MACGPGGCGGGGGGGSSWLEARLLGRLILGSVFIVGLLWIEGHRIAAVSLASLPVVIFFFGAFLSRCLDGACVGAITRWRSSGFARKPGKAYCPECACELRDAPSGGLASRRECPECTGAWCPSAELLSWLQPYGMERAAWETLPAEAGVPPLCPNCAAPLENGTWTGFPMLARCAACRGHWIPRTTRVWFELNPANASHRR